jgi:hypothetical protein
MQAWLLLSQVCQLKQSDEELQKPTLAWHVFCVMLHDCQLLHWSSAEHPPSRHPGKISSAASAAAIMTNLFIANTPLNKL